MGEEGNSSRKRGQFLLADFGEQKGSWVLRRALAMLCLRTTIIGPCLC
jgi:hypothetical protein